MIQKIVDTEQLYIYVAGERDILQAEAMALTARLQFLSEFIYIAEHVNDLAMDGPGIPESLLEPWQLPYQAPQYTASANYVPVLNSHSASTSIAKQCQKRQKKTTTAGQSYVKKESHPTCSNTIVPYLLFLL
ncbi:hypothetical protein QQ045_028561 [Rhodiola kirilowii]